MKVRAAVTSLHKALREIYENGWSVDAQLALTEGKEYDVHAVVCAGDP